ncbi:MAG: SDR family oxidoreductase [Pseudomonadota bacterium]
MAKRFENQVALITGASRGIGYATAQALAAEGAHIVAVARTVGGLEELADVVEAVGGAITLVPLNITDDPGLQRLCAAVYERWGRADMWLHTAVHSPPLTPATQVQEKDLDKSLAISIRAFQRLVTMVDPLLRAAPAGRAVILTEDTPGKPFNAGIGAAKAAQAAIAASWQAETARTGPKVTLHTPPATPTAHRARSFPGEDRAGLTPLEDVAVGIVEVFGG